MAIKDNQLARIVAPGLNEVDYSDKMAIAFSNINENFKKIASLPFLQGVAGDSYQLQEYKIIIKQNDPETDDLTINNTLCLTKEGASLFNTIFDTNVFTEGNYFNDICDNTDINKDLNGKKVLDFFIDENGNIINNKLYFYVIKNDADEVIEDSKHLGQYFYFVDGRIKELGNAYYNTDKTGITDFNDYSGFFQYNPETETYYRVDILPTLYYDAAKNDICWKFYGKETGISAIGVAGANGNDATFQFVKVKPTNESDCSAKIEYIFDFNAQNTTDYWIPVNNSDILNGPAVISIETQDNKSIAFGQIMGETAYWDNNTVLNNLVTSETISKYFYNMGFNQGNYPLFLAIPMSYNRNNNNPEKNNAHTIYSNEYSDLVFRGVENAWIGSDGIQQNYNAKTDEKHNIVFENYDLDLNKNNISNVDTIGGNEIDFTTVSANDVISKNVNTEHITTNTTDITNLTAETFNLTSGKISQLEADIINVNNINSNYIYNNGTINSEGDITISNESIILNNEEYKGYDVVKKYWVNNNNSDIITIKNNVKTTDNYTQYKGFSNFNTGSFSSKNTTAKLKFPKTTYTIKTTVYVPYKGGGSMSSFTIKNIFFKAELKDSNSKIIKTFNKTFPNENNTCDIYSLGSNSNRNKEFVDTFSIDAFEMDLTNLEKNKKYTLYISASFENYTYKYSGVIDVRFSVQYKYVSNNKTWTVEQSKTADNDKQTIVFKNGVVSGYNKQAVAGLYTIAESNGTNPKTYLFTTYLNTNDNKTYYKEKSISDIIGNTTQMELK
jgi:uncharacterized protein YifN (PemK superfamily)